MNNKFFGNALDLFKYDVLEHIAQKSKSSLFYVPMLTEPETKKIDPKYLKYELGANNNYLLNFLKKAFESDVEIKVREIRNYFKTTQLNYQMVVEEKDDDANSFSLKNIRFFSDSNREEYFSQVIEKYQKSTSPLIFFIDPDVGLENKIVRRVRSMRHKYLLNEELKTIIKNCKKGDIICYFQHLGNHNYPMEQRMSELREEFGENILLFGYTRILGSLVFITKSKAKLHSLKILIEGYRDCYRGMANYDKMVVG